jgi:large subunit ribosomal protein L29
MPLPKIEDARNLNDQELADEILAAKRELFEFADATSNPTFGKAASVQAHSAPHFQLMTVERERELAAAAKQHRQTEAPQPDAQEE